MLRVLALLLFLAAGCARADEARTGGEASAWIEAAKDAHREADAKIAAGDRAAARDALARAFDVAPPPSIAPEDRRVVRQDLAYRLAELALSEEDARTAKEWADRGLEQGRAGDVFTANLLIVRGRAREMLGDDRAAVDDYFEALEINEALLRRTLDGTPPEGP